MLWKNNYIASYAMEKKLHYWPFNCKGHRNFILLIVIRLTSNNVYNIGILLIEGHFENQSCCTIVLLYDCQWRSVI